MPADEDESIGEAAPTDSDEDRGPESKIIAPSSMGLRFQVPAGTGVQLFTATWGEYNARREADETGRIQTYYDRTPCEVPVEVDLNTIPSVIAPYAKGRVMQCHNDTFDVPKEATLLASSEKFKHQIYSVGRNAIAFQCHIEVTNKILADWFVGGAGRFVENKEMLQTLRRDTDTYVPGMSKVTTSFLTEWLDQRLPMKEKAYA